MLFDASFAEDVAAQSDDWGVEFFEADRAIFGGSVLDEISQLLSQQVGSLTQFYLVNFSNSGIGKKDAVSTNALSRFVSVVVDGVLGPPRLARHT